MKRNESILPRPQTGGSFFLGIGGISMGALAALALESGERVGGYDAVENDLTCRLSAMGIPITYAEHTESAAELLTYDRVVYSLAIPSSAPLLQRAKAAGICCESRPAYLGRWMQRYSKRICVAGMHGKSTTTAMLASVYLAQEEDPTVLCGAALPFLDGLPYRQGTEHGTLLLEACEYRDAFLSFSPTTALLLNVDLDHVDYFSSLAQIQASMGAFAKKAERTVANGEDPYLMEALKAANIFPVTFGFSCQNDYTAQEIRQTAHSTHFTFCHRRDPLTELFLPLGGRHHLQDALAAAAVAHAEGISLPAIAKGLSRFCGAARRMECLGTWQGAKLYSDYAHHPTELKASLALGRALAQAQEGRLLCVFQSHTYSRSAGLHQAFAQALSSADHLWILPIYAAREENTFGASPEKLADDAKGVFLPDPDALPGALQTEIRKNDLVLFLGAGDIDTHARKLIR